MSPQLLRLFMLTISQALSKRSLSKRADMPQIIPRLYRSACMSGAILVKLKGIFPAF